MKETFYFSHDYNARTNEKIKKLIRTHGMNGYGIFWSIVEDLYNNENAMRTDYDGIAYDLRTEGEIIKSIVNDFDLFEIKKEFFSSRSIEKRLDERKRKTESARQSANKRWGKKSNDLINDYDRNPNAFTMGAIYKGKYIEDINDTKNENTIRIPEPNPLSASKNQESDQEEILIEETIISLYPIEKLSLKNALHENSKSQLLVEEELQPGFHEYTNSQDEQVFAISREKEEIPENDNHYNENQGTDSEVKDEWSE